jgi:hypothetical protein
VKRADKIIMNCVAEHSGRKQTWGADVQDRLSGGE